MMEANRDPDMEISAKSSTTAGDITPTHSVATEDVDSLPDYTHSYLSPPPFIKETVPCPGNTYIIRHPVTGRQITLERGELRLKHHTGEQGGYHWVCVEKGGWLGFYDPIHGTYMGRNNKGGYMAKVKHHAGWENFCARRHPDGGYLLLTSHWFCLMKMDVDKSGTKLVETFGEGKGTAWEFVKV
ncbi:uncharacterized protein GGS22DRAFT_158523 [Annulohypoxylon maeteangense]|uniref:uncharacterized protein n=1 Tax=Annulohypoxylon maeteangense TaxID=1927788 RepID=UPI00200869A3|nr:uncharacterized protein GGS22DRAFT_158523 [Annulohypoxylon maeteangense]KAI0886710.1 hypothetical protein GGS22DRAFT_158523 [Annulohypoxylon maeteangense]